MAEAEKVEFEVVTPAHVLASGDADMVVVPGGDGNFGVLPGHSPLQSTVKPGVIEVWEKDKVVKSFFVEGGFADVTTERCTVLAEVAMAVEDIIRPDAEARLERARTALEQSEDFAERRKHGRELAAAEAMLEAANRR